MAEPYFIYKNISSKDMWLLVNELPPIIKAPRDMNKIIIPGRDGFLTEDFGTYGSIVKSCKCTILDIAMADQILAWLDGSGDVVFSNQDDRKYEASIINQIPFERILEQWHKFIVIFDCQPFAYALENDLLTFITSPSTFYNLGTTASKPIIKVYGDGEIDLVLNSKTINLTNVDDYVTIDSKIMDAYRDTTLKNSEMTGDFPELIVGENVISWTGTVTKVEVTPNWRWL